MAGDIDLRVSLGRLIRELLEEGEPAEESIGALIREHLGDGIDEIPVHGEHLSSFELANLQLALNALLEREGYGARIIGIAGAGHGGSFMELGLGDLMSSPRWGVGAAEYVNESIGPNDTLPCLVFAVLLVTTPEGPLCALIHRGADNGPAPGISIQALAADPELAQRFLANVRALMEELDVFRGQMITVQADRRGSLRIVFLERPTMDERELVLPQGVLERIERHVVGPSRHRRELLARGRHLSRGLLLWGPPGTGKTHTVRYLTSRLTEATIVILSGSSLGMVGMFGPLARRLQPAVIILEDVDLVAQERTFGPFGGGSTTLFELMNEMSGLDADADIAFILTTNRPDALEPALAARPGRVDLAIEIPLPDKDARRRLLGLYGNGLTLDVAALEDIEAGTEGMTASFFKELLRKATLAAIESDRDVTAADLRAALAELLDERAALTRVLLGSEAPAQGTAAPHAWMQADALRVELS